MLLFRRSIFIIIFLSISGLYTNCRLAGSHQQGPKITAQQSQDCKAQCLSGKCNNGTGKYEFPDCSIYEGEFQNGLRNGKGEYRFPSGTKLLGHFDEGRPIGAFEYHFPEGAVFRGRIHNENSDGDVGLSINGATGFLELNGQRRSCQILDFRLHCGDPIKARVSEEQAARADVPVGLKANEIKFLLLYAPQSARLLRNNQEYSVDSGYPLAPGDTIITTQHAADIQGEGGFAIRLKPFSELYIPLDARDERVLQLNRGSLIVDYDGEGPLPFRVRSGGLNVDVKGTTFVVEAGDDKNRVKVRVLEGEVKLSRDSAVLDKVRKGDLKKYPNLEDAIQRMEGTVSLTAGDEATATVMDPGSNPDDLASSASRDSGPKVSEASEEDLRKDEQEAALMPVLPEKDFSEAREDGLSGDPEDRQEAAATIEKRYRKEVESRGDDLEQQLQISTDIKTPEDFKKAYPVLEVVHMIQGTRRAGSIIAQAGGLLFLYAPDGLYRVPIEDVDYVDYYNQDEMDMDILTNPDPDKKSPKSEE